MSRPRRPGIFIGGAFGGMKDIGEAVIQASAAASGASRVLHAAGGSLALEEPAPEARVSLMREFPRILAVDCCMQRGGRRGALRFSVPDALGRSGHRRRGDRGRPLHDIRLGTAGRPNPGGEPEPAADRCLPAAPAPAQAPGGGPGTGDERRPDGGGRHRSVVLSIRRGAFGRRVGEAAGRCVPVEVGGPRSGRRDPGYAPGLGGGRRHCRDDRGPRDRGPRLRSRPGGAERPIGGQPQLAQPYAGRPGCHGPVEGPPEAGREASAHPGAHRLAGHPCRRRGRFFFHRGRGAGQRGPGVPNPRCPPNGDRRRRGLNPIPCIRGQPGDSDPVRAGAADGRRQPGCRRAGHGGDDSVRRLPPGAAELLQPRLLRRGAEARAGAQGEKPPGRRVHPAPGRHGLWFQRGGLHPGAPRRRGFYSP